ncbi:MAG: DUF4040 domain-containing protein [Wenzhouxiangella sp.]|nr:MAG: DUF4040 domain-containing protein [Wenzhouxiangella sp.]
MIGFLLDGLIAAGLVGLAYQAVTSRSLFRGIIHFVVFGLTMALAWARVGAPDLAMAEAAIGAGLTGALMLVAYRRLVEDRRDAPVDPGPAKSRLALPIAIGSGLLVGVIGLSALFSDVEPGQAGQAVLADLQQVDLGNPITGVLLLYRGIDTLLEVAVLLTAFLAARALAGSESGTGSPTTQGPETPMVGALLAVVIPLTVLVSVHLLRAGSYEPGGAFQAGAVLAGAGVLLILSGRIAAAETAGLLVRMGLLAGLVSFILIGLTPLLHGGPLLALPGLWAVYFIETAMMVSIAITLVLLFAGGGGLKRGKHG